MEEAQQRIDSRQFTEWMAYARLEPFGQDYLHTMIAQQTLATGNLKKGTKVEDLVPGEEPPHDLGAIDVVAHRRNVDSVMALIGATRKR